MMTMMMIAWPRTTIRSSKTGKILLPLATISSRASFCPQFTLSVLNSSNSYTPTDMDTVKYSQYISQIPSERYRRSVIQELAMEDQEMKYYYSEEKNTIDYFAYAQRYPPFESHYPRRLTRGIVVAMKRVETRNQQMMPENTISPIPEEILSITEYDIRSSCDFFMTPSKPLRAQEEVASLARKYYTKVLHSQYTLRPSVVVGTVLCGGRSVQSHYALEDAERANGGAKKKPKKEMPQLIGGGKGITVIIE